MRYLALDLEVHRRTEEIRALAGVYADGETFVRKSLRPGALAGALAELDDFAERADIVLGHNLINFDLQHLRAAAPGLRLLSLPALDTLMLSPLAFPKNPYHRLVKHYQDGDLVRERRNDPEYDSRLALTLFADERKALAGAAPDLLLAWHWLTSAAADQAAFDAFFGALRQARRPSEEDARAAIDRLLRGKACATRGREVAVDAAPRIAGPRMRVNELPVVSADAQRPFGTRAVVRLRRVPERTGVARRWLDARRHRGADDGGQPRPRPWSPSTACCPCRNGRTPWIASGSAMRGLSCLRRSNFAIEGNRGVVQAIKQREIGS